MTRAGGIFFAAGMLLLSACGSGPSVQDRYYSLVLAASDSAVAVDAEDTSTRLIVGPVLLPSPRVWSRPTTPIDQSFSLA